MMMNKAECESLSSYNSEVEEKHVRHINNQVGSVNLFVFLDEDEYDDAGDCVFNLGNFSSHNSEDDKYTDNYFQFLTIISIQYDSDDMTSMTMMPMKECDDD